MMGRWVLSGAFLMCFLLPDSSAQEHIPIWFKNNQAKYKRTNLQNIPKALPGTNGSSNAVFELIHFPGSTPLVAAENGEPMFSDTFGVDFIPELNCSQNLLCLIIRPVMVPGVVNQKPCLMAMPLLQLGTLANQQ